MLDTSVGQECWALAGSPRSATDTSTVDSRVASKKKVTYLPAVVVALYSTGSSPTVKGGWILYIYI